MVHHGRNIKRLREILGVKQGILASEFNITQQAVSDLERKAQINDDMLERIANVLKVPVDAIKNFNEEATVNIIANTINDGLHDNSSFFSYQPINNQIDKVVEVMERLLKTEQEKNILLEKLLVEKR